MFRHAVHAIALQCPYRRSGGACTCRDVSCLCMCGCVGSVFFQFVCVLTSTVFMARLAGKLDLRIYASSSRCIDQSVWRFFAFADVFLIFFVFIGLVLIRRRFSSEHRSQHTQVQKGQFFPLVLLRSALRSYQAAGAECKQKQY